MHPAFSNPIRISYTGCFPGRINAPMLFNSQKDSNRTCMPVALDISAAIRPASSGLLVVSKCIRRSLNILRISTSRISSRSLGGFSSVGDSRPRAPVRNSRLSSLESISFSTCSTLTPSSRASNASPYILPSGESEGANRNSPISVLPCELPSSRPCSTPMIERDAPQPTELGPAHTQSSQGMSWPSIRPLF